MNKLTCGYPYCDQPGIVYISRTVGESRRMTVITGDRAGQLGSAHPLEIRCIDCVHHELDLLIAGLPVDEGLTGQDDDAPDPPRLQLVEGS